ncbi:hypothetical protein ACVDFE_20570 [Lentzea chajnantorensis]
MSAAEPEEPNRTGTSPQQHARQVTGNNFSGTNYGTALQAGVVHGGINVQPESCQCGIRAIGACVRCRRPLCSRHAPIYADPLLCTSCAVADSEERKAAAPALEAARKLQEQERQRQYLALPLMDPLALATWLTTRPGLDGETLVMRPGPVDGARLLRALQITRIPPRTRPNNDGSWWDRRRNPVITLGWPVRDEHKSFNETSGWSEKRYLQPDGRTLVERWGMRTSLPTDDELLPSSHLYEHDDLFQARMILHRWKDHYPGGATLLPEV